jgi:hypothetical protein
MTPHVRDQGARRTRRLPINASSSNSSVFTYSQESDRVEQWRASLAQYSEQNGRDTGGEHPNYEEIDSERCSEEQALKALKVK